MSWRNRARDLTLLAGAMGAVGAGWLWLRGRLPASSGWFVFEAGHVYSALASLDGAQFSPAMVPAIEAAPGILKLEIKSPGEATLTFRAITEQSVELPYVWDIGGATLTLTNIRKVA